MATINEIIERVDNLRRNVYDEADKARWIIEVEGRVCKEIFGHGVDMRFPEDGDEPLKLRDEESQLYEYYVYCMIDWHNREFTAYNNDFTLFNYTWENILKEYGKKNKKKTKFINVEP